MIGIVDYGVGNLASLSGALRQLGVEPMVTSEPDALFACSKLILPGVGAFGAAMGALDERKLIAPLTRFAVELKRPVLGICLGCQLIVSEGEEFGNHKGLGWLAGRCVRIESNGLRMPHTGWNELAVRKPSILLEGIAAGDLFYFVHSFHVVADDPETVVATTDYGGPVTAMVEQGNIFAVQFHPEKSQKGGLQLLRNFVNLA